MAANSTCTEPLRIVSGALTIEVGDDADTRLITLHGELDMASSPSLQDELHRSLMSEAERIVLDLGGLEFVDSTGIRCLMLATSRSRGGGDRLRMLPPVDGQVADVLKLTRLGDVLPMIRR